MPLRFQLEVVVGGGGEVDSGFVSKLGERWCPSIFERIKPVR
jgi:hypothetical protein